MTTLPKPEEKEIMPGIYMTDFRRKTPSDNAAGLSGKQSDSGDSGDSGSAASRQEDAFILESDEGSLMREIDKLNNSILHLVRSNSDMREFDPNGLDSDLRDAIRENLLVIERQARFLERLQDAMEKRHGKRHRADLYQQVMLLRQQEVQRYQAPASSDDSSGGVWL